MDRKTRWRSFWLALLTVLAICVLIPSMVDSERLPLWFNKLFNKKIQAGLDLQGGFHIIYSIDLNKAVDDKASEIKRDLEARMDERKIEGRVTTPAVPVGAVNVIPDTPDGLAAIQSDGKFLGDYDETVIRRECPADLQGKALCVRVSSDYADGIRDTALDQAILTIRERINAKGIAEPSVKRKGDQIIVELPGLDEESIEAVKDLIARTAKLEFKIVHDNSDYMRKLYGYVEKDPEAAAEGITGSVDFWTHDDSGKQFNDYELRAKDKTVFVPTEEAKDLGCYDRNKREIQGKVECTISGRVIIERYLTALAEKKPEYKIDDDHQVGYEMVRPGSVLDEESPEPYWRTFYLYRAVELSGSSVSDAYVYFNPTTTRPEVLVDFNRYGGRRFGEMTGKNVGKKMAIILDDKVASAPVIQSRILGGRSSITMGGSNNKVIKQEADDLVRVLKTGSLPAPLQEEQSSVLGPLLGRDAVNKAKLAFILGSLLVVLIMIWVYRVCGVISIVALALNILYMMALLAAFGAVLTLPGIAAVVLTVGMAVDANIIIYERVREELRAGKSIRGAVDAGFSRGFAAIFDGQLTTAVAGWVLMQYGSGPIRGFAVMLIIGIVCTLFTATWCTRLFFEYYVGKGRKVTQIAI